MAEAPEQQLETEKPSEDPKETTSITPALKNLFDELKLVSDGFLECLSFPSIFLLYIIWHLFLLASHDNFALLIKMNELTAQKYGQSATELEQSADVLAQVFEKRFYCFYSIYNLADLFFTLVLILLFQLF